MAVWEIFSYLKGNIKLAPMGGVIGIDYNLLPFILDVKSISDKGEILDIMTKLQLIEGYYIKYVNKLKPTNTPSKDNK